MEPESTPIVPAQRLLDVAASLADGAARMHGQLRGLDPARRDALLELVTGQIASMVGLWAELVRSVVDVEAPAGPPVAAPPQERLASVPDSWDVSHAPPPEPGPDPQARRHLERQPGPQPDGEPRLRPEIRVVHEAPDTGLPGRTASEPSPVAAGDGERLTRDELTGVLNRSAGMAALGREVDRGLRNGSRFVLGYLNVDGLRRVNETLGPRGGDELLRKVTAALRASLRSYDVIMRLEGDEFLFSLAGADLATAEQRLREFGVILGEEAPGASASVGFAELRAGDGLDDLIARADHALVSGRHPRRRIH